MVIAQGLAERLHALQKAVDVKTAILVEGVSIDPAIARFEPFKKRTEHLYRHHSRDESALLVPQELLLFTDDDLTWGEPVTVNVRVNAESSWRLMASDGGPALQHDGAQVAAVTLAPAPRYYEEQTSGGLPLWRVAQSMGTDMVGVVPHNYCAYFAKGDECRFCEIVPNYAQARTYPKARKSIDDQIEALVRALELDPEIHNVVITAGNHRTVDETADLYVEMMREVRRQLGGRDAFIFGSLMAPETIPKLGELHEAGFDAIGLNMEVWDPGTFERMVPGKARYGRDRLLSALAYAVDVFGPGMVFSNLPYGIQSLGASLKGSSYDPLAENELSLEADRGLLAIGVIPLHTLYHTAGDNVIGPVALSLEHVNEYFRQYAATVFASGLVPASRNGVFANLGSITNHPYNDAYVARRAELILDGDDAVRAG